MRFYLNAFLFIALGTSASSGWALDAQQVFERVSASVVAVKAGKTVGSGVVFGTLHNRPTPETGVLTSCHLVKGHTHVMVERLGKKSTATVFVCDPDRDMAVIFVEGVMPETAERKTPLKIGEAVFAVGVTYASELSISQGIVSQLRPTALGKDPIIQTTAAITQGSNGGGLFDSEGRLVGLTTLHHKEGQAFNFAVPVSFGFLLKNSANMPSANTQQPCGWVYLGEPASGSFKHYIDYCKITGTGRYRTAWTMGDHKEAMRAPNGLLFVSTVTRATYDCLLFREARTGLYAYKDPMAKGEMLQYVTNPESDGEFNDVPPDSMAALQIATVCA